MSMMQKHAPFSKITIHSAGGTHRLVSGRDALVEELQEGLLSKDSSNGSHFFTPGRGGASRANNIEKIGKGGSQRYKVQGSGRMRKSTIMHKELGGNLKGAS